MISFSLSLALLPAAGAEDPPEAPEAEAAPSLSHEWTWLYQPRRARAGIAPLPEDSPLEPLVGFQLEGIKPDHPFLIGTFSAGGRWGVARGLLFPAQGTDTALCLARAEEFDLDALLYPEGLGGWFVLFGWENGHGYGIYNVEMKESGSPWFTCEFRDSKAIKATHGEISRYSWKGAERLRMTLKEKKLSLKIGDEMIVNDYEYPNYSAGDLIIGTYDTQYGPKRLRIQSLRIRAPE